MSQQYYDTTRAPLALSIAACVADLVMYSVLGIGPVFTRPKSPRLARQPLAITATEMKRRAGTHVVPKGGKP
jgi:hypothetical protein